MIGRGVIERGVKQARLTSRAAPARWAAPAGLLLLAAVLYLPGLTSMGLASWQEAQRVAVAREMWAAGDWLVPTINGSPYLAKPPLFYWLLLLLAAPFGRPPGEAELRLLAAASAAFGVLATWWAACRLARAAFSTDPAGPEGERHARNAALWAGLFLATGPIFGHAARVGEIDVLLPGFVALAVGAAAENWRRRLVGLAPSIPLIALATVAAAGAALTKGPPALLVFALAALGGPALWVAGATAAAGLRGWRFAFPIAFTLVPAAFAIPQIKGAQDALGALLLVPIGLVLGLLAARLSTARALRDAARAVLATGAPVAIAVAVLAFLAWGRAAAARVGVDVAAKWAGRETGDNLRLFDPDAPYLYATNLAWGLFAGSFLAMALLWWILQRRPRLGPGACVLLAWLGLGYAVFALFAQGFPRYLLPVWPAVAILGGIAAAGLARGPGGPRARAVLAVVLSLTAAAQLAWFTAVRPGRLADRSPRDFVAALHAAVPGLAEGDLATLDFWTAAVDFYAGFRVQPVGAVNERAENVGGEPWTVDQLRAAIAQRGRPMLVLMREAPWRDGGLPSGPDRLRAAGMSATPIPLPARFRFDNGRARIMAAWVDVGE